MAREADLLRQPAHCLWVRCNQDDGRTHLDVAIVVADSTQARGIARACGAPEYYDLARDPAAIKTRTERDTEQFLSAV
jgi:hypothetical protein